MKEDGGGAAWYYEQLAILYGKQKRPREELGILERYAAQRHAPGVKPAKLAERLEKALTTCARPAVPPESRTTRDGSLVPCAASRLGR